MHYSETYTEAAENPDDISVENFATTDVAPGLYHLYAYNSNDTLYRDLGQYTFAAGRTTYVGLYPNYLPDVLNFGTWVSNITVRNNSESRTAKVNTTFFWSSGAVKEQRQDSLAPRASVTIPSATAFIGSALVMGSEDLSVVVESERDSRTERMNYTGIRAAGGSPGWETVGTTLYAPIVKRSYYGRSSALRITNTGSQSTEVYVEFYNASGASTTVGPYPLAAGARTTVLPTDVGNNNPNGGCPATVTLCSARIRSSANQPLTATVDEYRDSDGKVATDHNLFSAGAQSSYLPVVKNHWYNNNTGLGVQNVGGGSANLTFSFYDQVGNLRCTLYRNLPPPCRHCCL